MRTLEIVLATAVTAISLAAAPPEKSSGHLLDTQILAERFELPKSQRRELMLDMPKPQRGREPYLFFRAAAKSSKPGGYCNQSIQILVGGEPIDSQRLSNRPPKATMMNGHVLSVAQGNGTLLIPWAPDFTSTDNDPVYGLVGGVKAAEFELYLGGLLNEGKNTLALVNTNVANLGYTVLFDNVELRIRDNPPTSELFAPAPAGDLPVIVPKTSFPKPYRDLRNETGKISVTVSGRTYRVESRFSTPDAQWATAGNPHFQHRRDVTEHDEWIEVRDTFVNQTGENLPIIQEHRVALGDAATGVWLAGSSMPTKSGSHAGGDNPSAFAATADGSIGLVALNDEFRVHTVVTAERGSITLADRSFVLAPGATYTAEWAIVPAAEPDFYTFINAARRMLDVNFTLDVCFAFMFHEPPVYEWSDAKFKKFIDNKSANFVVKSNYGVRTKEGHPARSTDWIAGPHTIYRDFHDRVRRLYPDRSVKTGIYYHCFLDTHQPNRDRFAADRALDSAGNHISYGSHTYMHVYVPTLEPGHWGEEIAKVVDVILDSIGVDGVFWDEFSHSAAPWVYSHFDGCSADIDPKTHRIRRLKGSMSLLSRDFRLKMVRKIQDRGAVLIVNGAPSTRTLANRKMPAFTETGSISHCRKMLLYSPMALGDHLTERSQRDAYRVMLAALDYGCLYAWYGSNVYPDYPTLTEHMYPTTPIEIHPGYVIGRERIITNRSGLFGWDDTGDFTAYVYDREGRATDEYPVKKVDRDGKTYAEVRIPGGYSAAVVRAGKVFNP